MNDKYCGEYTTYSEKIRNLLKSIESYRRILDYSSGNSFNLDVIFSIEGILEKLSHYQNNTSKICQSALKKIRNIRSDNGNSIFKKRKKQLNFTDFNKIKSIINEVIDTINEELPKEEDLDAIEIDLINKKYSNKQLGEAIRNHAREIVYVLCSEDKAKNIIIEPSIGKNLEELLRYINDQRDNLAPQYSTPLEKRTDKIQEIILAENFSHLEGAIARCSRKIAQIISNEMQLEENKYSHNGKAISKEDEANR